MCLECSCNNFAGRAVYSVTCRNPNCMARFHAGKVSHKVQSKNWQDNDGSEWGAKYKSVEESREATQKNKPVVEKYEHEFTSPVVPVVTKKRNPVKPKAPKAPKQTKTVSESEMDVGALVTMFK